MPNERGAYDFLQLIILYECDVYENMYLPLKWLMNVTHIITIEIPNKCDANVRLFTFEIQDEFDAYSSITIWIQTECYASDYSSMKYQLNDIQCTYVYDA